MVKIVWLTAGCYLDHTLPILHHLNKIFDIKWVVFENECSFTAEHACQYAKASKINLELINVKSRWYNPLHFWECFQLIKGISKMDADIYYLDITTFPHLFFPIKKYLGKKKTLICLHQGKAHSGMRFAKMTDIYLNWLRKQSYYFHFYSNTQANFFDSDPKRKFVIHLPVNNTFGYSNKIPPTDKVVFQYFGHMISSKNVGLLIKAACKLKEQTDIPFVVRLYGHCRNWNKLYQPLIKYPAIFDLRIESLPDADIPDVFCSAHYLVQPYSAVTQSGPTKLAYGYHLPIIASNLSGFRESIVDDVTGIFFESENLDDLVATMKKCLDNHPSLYLRLKDSQAKYVHDYLSVEKIIDKFAIMFKIIANE